MSRTLLALALVIGVAAGCSSEDATSSPSASATPSPVVTGEANGLEDATAKQIYRQTRNATRDAQSYSVTGSIPGQNEGLDLQFDFTQTSAQGTLTQPGQEPIELVLTPEFFYIKGENALDPSVAGPDAEKKLEGKWLQIPADDPSAAGFAGFANGPTFADGLLSRKSKLTKGEVGEFAGVPAVELKSTGSLWVSLTGEPYPLGIIGEEQATVNFSNWNSVGEITTPPQDEVVTIGDVFFG